MRRTLDYDTTDLIFRMLFSLIFIGLGIEHLFADEIIRKLMPQWMLFPRMLSLLAGGILLAGGCSVLLGYRTHLGAVVLGVFLLIVTIAIHLPAAIHNPTDLSQNWQWLWDVYQRSNFVKNLCLLGVCFHLTNHRPGRYSLDARFGSANGGPGTTRA